MQLIGVDVGGTFTDLVFTDTDQSQRTITHKVPTTLEDPSEGVILGIKEICERYDIEVDGIDHVLHGTTIATNAILEHNGARSGMVTSSGYRDILHIGRHQRPQQYSIMQEIPWQNRPLVRRRHRKTVSERLLPPRGEVMTPLDGAEVREAARQLKAEGVEAIAVCFLFSYLDPRHEDRGQGAHPGRVPGLLRHHLGLGLAAISRVRALHHHRDERLRRPEGARLRAPARRLAQGPGARR